jgi:hypothetical protein
MNPVDADSLRTLIRGLPPDDKRLEREGLRELIQDIAADLRFARRRGVMAKTLAEVISKKTGVRVTREFLSDMIKAPEAPEPKEKSAAPEDEAAPALSVPKGVPDPKEKRVRKHKDKNFIAAAVTPEGELYQLEFRQVKGSWVYIVCQVDADGSLHHRMGKGFPVPQATLDVAVESFRMWGWDKGYELLGD